MNKIYTRKVEFDFNGDCIIEVPEEIVQYLDIRQNDILVWEVIEDKIILRKRKDL